MVIKDNVLYKIRDILNLLPKAFNYPNNKSSNSNNNIKLISNNSKNKTQEPT